MKHDKYAKFTYSHFLIPFIILKLDEYENYFEYIRQGWDMDNSSQTCLIVVLSNKIHLFIYNGWVFSI